MQVVQIRSQLSDLRQDAVNAVLQGVGEQVALPPTDDPEEQQKRSEDFLEIFRAYTRAIEAYELAREAHPLPTLPPDC